MTPLSSPPAKLAGIPISALPEIVLAMRPNGLIVEASPAAVQAYGYDRAKLLTLRLQDLQASGAPEPDGDLLAGAEAGALRLELVHQRQDGTTFPVEVCAQAVDLNGEQLVIGVLRDISSRRKREEDLRLVAAEAERREAETAALMASTRAVLEMPDFQSEATVIFGECRRLTGAKGGYISLLTPDGRANEVIYVDAGDEPCAVDHALPMPIRGLREQALRTGQPVYHNDFSSTPWAKLLPPGHAPLANVLFAPLVIERRAVGLLGLGNKPGGFTADDLRVVTNLTEMVALALSKRLMLEQLERTVADLNAAIAVKQELQERLRDYIRALSHDLRNPLAVVSGHAQLLRRGLGAAELRDRERVSLDAIQGAAQQMSVMIGDLADSARLESGQMELEREPVALQQFIATLLDRSRVALDVGRVRLEMPTDLPLVNVDRSRCERILLNLLSNALKYSPRGEPVTVAAINTGTGVRISVIDRGIGIPAADLPHVFDRFFRAEASRKIEGLGLGLSITRQLVEAHGGRIWVESAAGQGSTFHVELPCRA